MPEPTPHHPASDRNLLFGILALQLDFVSRDGLFAAMNAWPIDKAKPLAQILAEQGALTEDDRTALDGLVDRHLRKHGGDPRQSLAAVGPVPVEIRAIPDLDLQASLTYVPSVDLAHSFNVKRSSVSVGAPTSSGRRFRILRPHARGGLGQVSVALDEDLHREVALKEIQEQHADHPESRARFVLEAEVTGGLEHPGIVPVYALGWSEDGRPFYAMRFVRGESLKDAIQRFHQADKPGRDPGERALALRQLLGRFVAVCNAVAYAHNRGVLHRDVKPANVMLGKFGETLLVDWGVAKAAGRSGEDAGSEEGPLVPALGGQPAATQLGSVVGTPPFMPPEQAAGRPDQMGPASDVYSLGATLYNLLTGRTPFRGGDVEAVLERVQRGEFPRPRQVNKLVPAALEAVCLKAMALRPADRYPAARALADEVERWLADEPVAAYREPLRKRLGRWRRRHPAVAAAAAVLLLGGLAAGVWVKLERDAVERDVRAALGEVERFQAADKWPEARAALERARGRLAGGGANELRKRVRQAGADLDCVAELEEIWLRQAEVVDGKFNRQGADGAYVDAFARYGIAVLTADVGDAARRVAASAVRESLVVALDNWATVKPRTDRDGRERLRAVAALADADPWRRRLRDPALANDRKGLVRLAEAEEAAGQPPATAILLSDSLWRVGERSAAVAALRRAQGRYPASFWLNMQLSATLTAAEPSRGTEALGFLRAGLAARPDIPVAYLNLTYALVRRGQYRDAEVTCRQALRLKADFPEALHNLSLVLTRRQKFGDAEAAAREALRLRPKLPQAHVALGFALAGQRRYKEAEAAYREALLLGENSSQVHYGLGFALADQGREKEAEAEYRETLRLDPDSAEGHTNFGNALVGLGRFAEAVAEHREAIRLRPDLPEPHLNLASALNAQGRAEDVPVAEAAVREALRLKPDYAEAHSILGTVLATQGRVKEAEAAHREALRLRPERGEFHTNFGVFLAGQKRYREAEAVHREALRLRPDLAEVHYNLGELLRVRGRFAEAVAELQRGKELSADRPDRAPRAAADLRRAEGLLELDRKLLAVLEGKARPRSPDERLALAKFCRQDKRWYTTAARLYAEAFADRPALAEGFGSVPPRYLAAGAAALAAAGEGEDAGKLTDAARVELRRQALGWLQAELALWGKKVEKIPLAARGFVAKFLQKGQADPDLAAVRDPAALARLPEQERVAWQRLWADAAALAEKCTPPAGGKR